MQLDIKISDSNVHVSGNDFSYTLPLPHKSVPVQTTTAVAKHKVTIFEEGDDFDSESVQTITYDVVNEILGVSFDNTTIYLYTEVNLKEAMAFVFDTGSKNYYWRHYISPIFSSSEKMNFQEYLQSVDRYDNWMGERI